jgi:hypothetical protein
MSPKDEEILAFVLLQGYEDEDERGLPKRAYLERGSDEERRAILHLSDIVRQRKLSPSLAEALANALLPGEQIDDKNRCFTGDTPNRLELKRRRRGQHRDMRRATVIFSRVAELKQNGEKTDDAIEHTGDQFGLSYETVRTIWKMSATYRRLLKKEEARRNRGE